MGTPIPFTAPTVHRSQSASHLSSSLGHFGLSARPMPSQFAQYIGREGVTAAHWVSDSLVDECSMPGCQMPVTIGRRHHCRRCGLILCDEHSLHRMRLDRQAQPLEDSAAVDHVGASWLVRVCDICVDAAALSADPKACNSRRRSSVRPTVTGLDGDERIACGRLVSDPFASRCCSLMRPALFCCCW